MGDKGEGGLNNLKKGVRSFMDGPKLVLIYAQIREISFSEISFYEISFYEIIVNR